MQDQVESVDSKLSAHIQMRKEMHQQDKHTAV